jgi:oligoribonuclease
MQNKRNWVWLDLEMTGLNPETEAIIEMASLITDSELNVIKEGPSLVIHQAQSILDNMDDWNRQHHGKSGLIQKVMDSPLNLREAETLTLNFIQQYVGKNESPLCGNSICQDRRFLSRYMPQLESYLHYRHIDVSTLKELSYRWYPNLKKYEKTNKHRALDDIYESLAELRYYRQHLCQTIS